MYLEAQTQVDCNLSDSLEYKWEIVQWEQIYRDCNPSTIDGDRHLKQSNLLFDTADFCVGTLKVALVVSTFFFQNSL